ncbi:MAG: O-antigen/teichoic acid export membrane protein [Flavobacteriales bacterium]|jgi:O-antigen/teichoic acid export membrane protein
MRRIITIGMNTIQGFASPAFNFLIVVFGVKVFGKADWASLINVMLWVFFVTFMLGWGNRDHLLRKYSQEPGKIYHAFFSNFLSRCLLLPFALLLLLFFPIHISPWAILLVILTFTYSSLSTLVVYHQKFSAQLLAEIVAFAIIFGSVFYVKTFDLETFLKIYTIAIAAKLVLLSVQMNFWKESFSATISIQEFKAGLPFFILGLSGWLMSKADIYVVDFYLEKSQLAEYQLFITAFLMLQALAAYMTIPFTKHVYRVSDEVVQKMKYKLYAAAFPLTILGGFAIWVVMEYFVKLGFTYDYYIVGGLIALPCYFYTLNIMELMKNHKERTIIYISFFGFFVNFSLIFLLIETYEIFGVLLSVCSAQWVVLLVYKIYRRFA